MKLKNELSKREIMEFTGKGYLTEIAFYIGTNNYIDNLIKEKLIKPLSDDYDGIVIFYLFVKFLTDNFLESNYSDVYEFVDYNIEDFIEKFIIKNCE